METTVPAGTQIGDQESPIGCLATMQKPYTLKSRRLLGEAEATDRQKEDLAVKYDGPTLTNVVVVQMGRTK